MGQVAPCIGAIGQLRAIGLQRVFRAGALPGRISGVSNRAHSARESFPEGTVLSREDSCILSD